MEMCIVAINYPTEKRQIHVFLDNAVKQFADRGIRCNVIAPQSSFSYYFKKSAKRDLVSLRKTEKGAAYTVYSPLYTVFPRLHVGNVHLADKSKFSFYRAVKKVYEQNDFHADVIYAHFFQAGIPAVMLGREKGIPSFIANGEADTLLSLRPLSRELVNRTLRDVTGIISVSSKCREEIGALYGGDPSVMEKVTVIPNAADRERFYKMDRSACREELYLPQDAFIAAFTGSFIPRKGVQKVAAAVDALDGVYGIFVGTGPEKPACGKTLFCGTVKNQELARYLNAADVFVLPTQAEGCPNAVVEAICCGLPVISSDRSFNRDILDESCAVLIDPDNQEEITKAVQRLRDDPLERERLGKGSEERAKRLSLDERIDSILRFIASQGQE